ncbi:A/G-specific adenine glycosylase [Epidermidibacterium keratini]|uniref:Adenine DNA glycosylase n=1 Tax=Epidermidibacterium keratini TaxID=1891644 RepID=A0A7L4YQ83_9ACTN|nr:A/G-specific adenine glycosylase [Epidermidibacterium keratini]QHC01044.1 A/G-specific adenine glycosylase [Epidermidibacterium keratini]
MPAEHDELTAPIADWYADHARELPWRGADVDPWAVMVSEFMLQQTPVARVIPAFEAWLTRWPSPAALAADSPGEAVRMWGKLGYPRRALRLHAAASEITTSHGGVVPRTVEALRSLPGVGDYTAAAIAVFGYGERAPVVDTNVRRVLHRAVLGAADAGPTTTKADMALCESLLPDRPTEAARLSIALMELGALVCTAASPSCGVCPVSDECAWQLAGRPEYAGPPKRVQRFAGTDRQVRGKLLDVLRAADEPVGKERLDVVWSDDTQRERALAGLLDDGLAQQTTDGRFALPA